MERQRKACDFFCCVDLVHPLSPPLRPPLRLVPRLLLLKGPRPGVTKYQQLNAPPVVPEGFEDWSGVMDTWGNKVSYDALSKGQDSATWYTEILVLSIT